MPPYIPPPTSDHETLVDLDRVKKAKMKEYADNCQHAKVSDIQEGDWVLVRQEQRAKTDSRYCHHPLQVTRRKGTMIRAASKTKRITRNVSHFKKCNPAAYTRAEEPECDTDESSRESEDREEPEITVSPRELREELPARRPQRAIRKSARLIEEFKQVGSEHLKRGEM